MSAQPFRVAEGGRIDRSAPLRFTYDGRGLTGYAGDTLASALLANGVRLVGRSFKYHRPRSIVSADSSEPNAIVQLGTGARVEPNTRATQIELYEGLSARSQNCWPNVRFDLGAWTNLLAFLFPAGFYYKTFMWPRSFWRRYEFFIRWMAGLGSAPKEPDPDIYEKMHAHCDVLVVGAGPAGLAAALAAGRTGARVIVADEQNEPGGSLLGARVAIAGKPALEWVAAAADELGALDEVRVLDRATVFGYYDHNFLTIVQRVTDHLGADAAPAGAPRQRLWRVRAKEVVLATGAHERPLVFADNDRPGVMLAEAARTYLNRYGVRPGRRAVVFTNNDGAYAAALDLNDGGVDIAAIVDVRIDPQGPLIEAARAAGLAVHPGHAVCATHGAKAVRAVDIAPLDSTGEGWAGGTRRLACDLVCVSGGWSPAVHLFSQSRGQVRYDPQAFAFLPQTSVQAERSAGAAAGAATLGACLSQGLAAGAEAAQKAGFGDGKGGAPPKTADAEGGAMRPLWEIPPPPGGRGGKRFVDLQNDVTVADIALSVREGYLSVEHLKRYTTAGMGTDQGKTGNVNALAILARATGAEVAELGHTTFRPPYTPVSFGALAGRDAGETFDPVRKTPMHEWHESAGAVFENVGHWKRPYCYPRSGESTEDAVTRECKAVGQSLGIVDASTLGKLDIQGPDSVTLLNHVYTNAWNRLEVGRCRYGLMLGENGMIFDDGVTARLGPDHFLMSTTTGGAAHVHAWLEDWLQCEWRDLKVWVTNVVTQYAVIGLVGPNARALLAEVCEDVELANEAFPFMAVREGTVANIPARIFRISFSGELSYEINVPASYGLALWQTLMTAGEKYEITPYGTEAMHVLRAEKGYIIVGEETDGTMIPADLGMDWIVSTKKKDFLGKRSLSRSDMVKADRKQLVGLLTEDPNEVLPQGAHIVSEVRAAPPMPMEGHVSSSYLGPRVGRSIALGLLKGGLARKGETVNVWTPQKIVRAKVTEPVFYDPEGERLRG